MKTTLHTLIAVLLGTLPALAAALTGVNPTGVNVNASGVTSVFLTFQGVTPTEVSTRAFWCGDITVPANTVVDFDPCVPGTLFGNLPVRNDLSRRSGVATSNLSDVMTIPRSVARRAYQQAEDGAESPFYYVREFLDTATGQRLYVAVTCRLAGGGARVPLALTNVQIAFTGEEVQTMLEVAQDAVPPSFGARIAYNGSGRIRGRWEVVLPGDPQPEPEDLLPEASLPPEQRGLQKRYLQIGRFDQYWPPGDTAYVPGPDPALLPTSAAGPYQVLLRIEASADREGNSNAVEGTVISGGVAGFPLPPLRYYVADDRSAAASGIVLLSPGPRQPVSAQPEFTWTTELDVAAYRIEFRTADNTFLSAITLPPTASYRPPPNFWDRANARSSWRVIGFDAGGSVIAISPERSLQPGTRMPAGLQADGQKPSADDMNQQ
jgi:hypothetical protein